MTRSHNDPTLSSLSLDSLDRIDSLCVAFESDLADQKQPRIEDFLKLASSDERQHLIRELLQLELAAKETLKLEVKQAEYETRFADFKRAVQEAFSDSNNDAEAGHNYVGKTIAGRYQVKSLLGSGGFSDVYLAKDLEQDRLVAVKVLKPQAELDLNHFISEAKTLSTAKHPNIVKAYDFGRFEDSAFIALQYIDGQTLAAKIAEEALMDVTEVIRVSTAISDALHCAHLHGLTHRDVKPHNILIDSVGHPYMVDFGLALHESVQEQHFGDRTGTPFYRSPEQVRGESDWIDGRADIWAVGAVLYEMLTGRRPFQSGTTNSLEEIDRQILGRSPKPPRQINSAVPAWLEAVCLKCLSKNPTDRYASASELARALRTETHPHKPRISRQLIWLSAVILLALGGIALSSLLSARSERIEKESSEKAALELAEDLIRNINDPLEKIAPQSGQSRRQLIENAVEAVDKVPSDSRYADLLRVNTRYRLAESLINAGGSKNLDAARSGLDEALAILQSRDGKSNSKTDRTPYLRLFGKIHDMLGQIGYLRKDFDDAFGNFEVAYGFRAEWLAIVKRAGTTNASPFANAAKDAAPEIFEITELELAEQAIGDSHYNFGRIYRKDPKKSRLALKSFEKATAAKQALFRSHPTYLPAMRDFGGILRDLAKAQIAFGQYDKAGENYRESIRITNEVTDFGTANPGMIDLYPPKANAAVYLSELGEVLMRSGKIEEALLPLSESQERLSELQREYSDDEGKVKYLRRRLGECWYLLGLQSLENNSPRAAECFKQSEQNWGGYDRIYPLARLHRIEDAIALTLQAQKSLAGIARVDYTLDLAKCFAVCAWSAKTQNRNDDYEKYRHQAVTLLDDVLRKGVPSSLVRDDLDLQFLRDDAAYIETVEAHFEKL